MDPRTVTHGSGGLPGDSALEATIVAEPQPPEPVPIPDRVGRYEVKETIGTGAMGVVLRAHDPRLDRVVAIKLLLRAHVPAGISEGRLMREARALARLSHPNVIDIYDVGMVDGRIFIAMEYVAGQTLDAWIEHHRPSHDAVIDAFVQAGRGLAAAHEAGLVHRDFKPANVLRGDDGRVRVVDFGLAAPPREHEIKTTLGEPDDERVDDVRMTATGLVVGTPAYMAPEAHCGDLVDARSDQFSFCVSLFEALWGTRPFRGQTPREVAAEAIHGRIQVPPGRGVPTHLETALRRGLRPSPADRWPSMSALLERLQPRRRRRWPALVAGGVLVAGLAGMPWLVGTSASTCDQQAEAVEQLWDDATRDRVHQAFARSELSYAEETWQRVQSQLDTHTQALASARRQACRARLTAAAPAELLDQTMACLEQQRAELRGAVTVLEQADADAVRNAVRVLAGLGSLDECDDPSPAATVAAPPDAVAAQVEQAHADLAQARAKLRAGHYQRAQALAREVLARVEPLDYPPVVARARFVLARALEEDGQYEAAEQEMSDALLTAQAAGHDELVAEASTELIYLVGSQLRRPRDAERWVRHARAAIGRLADPRRAETFLQSTLGNFHWSRSELDQAREYFERALAAREQQLGPRHPTTVLVRSNLGMVYHDLGDNTRARALTERTLADRTEVFGPSHPMVATTYGNLAVIEQNLGELDASAEHTQRALDLLEASVGRQHPHYGQLLVNLSNTEYYRGNLPQAVHLQEQARDLLVQNLGPRDFIVGRTLSNLGAFYLETERYDDARAALISAREILEEHVRPGHPTLASAIGNLAAVDRATGRLPEALAGYDESLGMLEPTLGADHPDLSSALLGRGTTYVDLERHDEALVDIRRAVALLTSAEVDPERVASARYDLAEALLAAGEPAEAIAEMERARALVDRPARSDDDLPAKIDAWLAERQSGSSG